MDLIGYFFKFSSSEKYCGSNESVNGVVISIDCSFNVIINRNSASEYNISIY